MLVQLAPQERTYEADYQQYTTLRRAPFVDGSHPSAIRPYVNLKNRFYVPQQVRLIGPAEPYVKQMQHNTINGAANTVFDFGPAASYRMTDETLRQFAVATLITRQQQSFFKTATR